MNFLLCPLLCITVIWGAKHVNCCKTTTSLIHLFREHYYQWSNIRTINLMLTQMLPQHYTNCRICKKLNGNIDERETCACSVSGYLRVSVEHFYSLGRDEKIHLCERLRLTLRFLHKHSQKAALDTVTCLKTSTAHAIRQTRPNS